MSTEAPFQEEVLTRDQAQSRLLQLGAQWMREFSLPHQHTYWVGASRVWIALTQEGHNYRLRYTRSCPCTG